jgi:Polyketide cyclase / dehydrase and lipid transport
MAMAHPLVVSEWRFIPIPPEEAFHPMLVMPLTDIFTRWYGPIPPIKEVRDQTGGWDAAGQSRTVLLTGGGSMHEELTNVDPPRSFSYRLSEVSGPMSILVDHVLGEWVFAPRDGGTELTWRWTIHRKSPLTAWALPVFGGLWKGYARQVLVDLSAALTTALR